MSHDVQKALLQTIVNRYKKTKFALADLQKLLDISKPAVYKRLNGSTQLTASEISLLFQHYQISPSSIFKMTESQLLFDFSPLVEDTIMTGNYLLRIKDDLNQVAKSSDSLIQYISTDIPFFYYFLDPELAWFKLFVFQISQANTSVSQLPKISFSTISSDLRESFTDLFNLYSSVDSVEVWTSRAFIITMDQIKYFSKAQLFLHPEDALRLMDKLVLIVDQVLEMVENANKNMQADETTEVGTLQLYYNDIDRFNPTILTSYRDVEALYLTYSLPNFLYTKEPAFITYTKDWIERIKLKAYNLSSSSDIERLHFFGRIKKIILEERLKMEREFFS